jgi:hypothetical protein
MPIRWRSLRQRSQRRKLRLPLNLRSLTLDSPRLFFIWLSDLAGVTDIPGWGDLSMGRGWELI